MKNSSHKSNRPSKFRSAGNQDDEQRSAQKRASKSPAARNSKTRAQSFHNKNESRKESLSNLGGPFRTWGDPGLVQILKQSFVAAEEKPADELTHPFHTYPARMHPWMARVLVQRLTRQGDQVLDPFCGSGTVPLEAMVWGRKAIAVDLNPISVRLTQTKCFVKTRNERKEFLGFLQVLAEKSFERIQTRVHSQAPLQKKQLQFYPPQTLKEFAGLLEEIETVQTLWIRRALEMVFSSLVYKFSFRRSDSSPELVQRNIRKGLPTEFFVRKGKELERRWAELARKVSKQHCYPTETYLGNSLWLSKALPEGTKVDHIISSPPYGGTYDYHHHHDLRFEWLKLNSTQFENEEMGSRRGGDIDIDPCENWNKQMLGFLRSARRILKAEGQMTLILGDAQFGERRIFVEKQIRLLAAKSGFSPLAICSQKRTDWTQKSSRYEHAILLGPLNSPIQPS